MKLALGTLALAAISLFTLSWSTPVVIRGHQFALQVTLEPHDNQQSITEEADNTTTKYFHEPGSDDFLGHYDIRFYRGSTVSYEERTDALHHMIRAYLTTFRKLNIETWIAHGTLLGWWWNSQILPWDWDLDVQVSGETLSFMGEYLNFTTHNYKSGDVERQYFLDVNPYHVERTRGDGWNIIDARWIDVRNGLFIDITGISETNPTKQPDTWSCKNEHIYNRTDIWPLRETFFEGVTALVPFAYSKILTDEYEPKALTMTEYEGHYWNPILEKWILNDRVSASEHLPLPTNP